MIYDENTGLEPLKIYSASPAAKNAVGCMLYTAYAVIGVGCGSCLLLILMLFVP